MALCSLWAAFAVPAQAAPANLSYNFSTLTTGTLVGQSTWYNTNGYTYQGTGVVRPGVVPGSATTTVVGSPTNSWASYIAPSTFYSGTESAAVLQFDIHSSAGWAGGNVFLAGRSDFPNAQLANDWTGDARQTYMGPEIGFYNSLSDGKYDFTMQVKDLNGKWTQVTGAANDGPTLGDWISMKLVMNFTAPGGDGSGSLFYKDLTLGQTGWTAVASLQGVNLGLSHNASVSGPSAWNQIGFFMAPNTGSEDLTNIFAGTIPEPASVALLGLGAMAIALRLRRKV
jgi:hypothetical protein